MIICCGEALIDMLPRKLEDGSDVFLPVPGGAMFNTAVSLGRLGENTGFISGISTDLFGSQLIDFLSQSNVDSSLCMRSDLLSTLAVVALENGHANYLFFDERSAGRMVEQSQLPSLPKEAVSLHFGAISLMQEPCGATYEALMEQAHENHVISIDPNIRPDFAEDEEAHRARITRMIALSDIVKVSDEDLKWLAGGKDEKQLLQSWLEGAASIVLMTKGSSGAVAYTRDGELSVPAKKVTVVDTVGAGDTFNAGFLSGLRKAGVLDKESLRSISKADLRSALERGVQVAAFTVSQAGANSPWLDQLEAS